VAHSTIIMNTKKGNTTANARSTGFME